MKAAKQEERLVPGREEWSSRRSRLPLELTTLLCELLVGEEEKTWGGKDEMEKRRILAWRSSWSEGR